MRTPNQKKKTAPKKGFCHWQFNIKFTIIISSIFAQPPTKYQQQENWLNKNNIYGVALNIILK